MNNKKKHGIRRHLAALLAIVMMMQLCLPVAAAENEPLLTGEAATSETALLDDSVASPSDAAENTELTDDTDLDEDELDEFADGELENDLIEATPSDADEMTDTELEDDLATPSDATAIITAFAALPEEVSYQNVAVGAEEASLTLPETLTVLTDEVEWELSDITWIIDADNSVSDTFASGEEMNGAYYVYTPVLPETDGSGNAITVAEGVELPEIDVLVGEYGVATLAEDSVASVNIGGATTHYDTIDTAWAAAKAGTSTITLLQSCEASSRLSLTSSDTLADITLNLGNFTLTVRGENTLTAGTLTVRSDLYGSITTSAGGAIFSVNGATLNITGGDFNHTGDYANCHAVAMTRGTLNISGGSFQSTNAAGLSVMAIDADESPYVVTGGSFSKIKVADSADGTVTMTLADLLGTGYGYRSTESGNAWVTDAVTLSGKELSNVTVAKIPVEITTQPTAEATLAFGSTVTLTVATDVTENVTYQWYDGETAIAGATQASYTTNVNMAIGEHSFSCQVSCKDYTVTSNAVPITYSYDEPTLVDGVYQIASASNLMWFAAKVNGTENTDNQSADAVLTADIDMADITWPGMTSYSGTFDGAGHVIKNLNSSNTGEGAYGLVQVLQSDGVIKNLKFDTVNVFINAANRSAVIAGENNGTITGCTVTNATVQCGNYVGLAGIAAANNSTGVIENCAVLNSTLKRRYTGGNQPIGCIAGSNNGTNGTIKNCYSYKVTFSTGGEAGGIVASGTAPVNSYFYTTSTPTSTVDGTAKTTDEFASGEVAYLLNGSTSEGETLAWYQNLDNGETVDAYPVLDSTHGTVYFENSAYTNTPKMIKPAGEGTKSSPYQIANAENLYWFAAKVNGTEADGTQQLDAWAVLTTDITVNTNVLNADGSLNETDSANFRAWTPIGNEEAQYKGSFDGHGHTISGLYFNDTSCSNVGLFGYCYGNDIKNVSVTDTYMKARERVGGVIGTVESSPIYNCSFDGTIVGTDNYIGGICGYNDAYTEGCSSNGSVSGKAYVGGIYGGSSHQFAVVNCVNNSAVSGSGRCVGGISGLSERVIFEYCINNGSVSGGDCVGGISGYYYEVEPYTYMTECVSNGSVHSTDENAANVGGVCGYVNYCSAKAVYFNSSKCTAKAVGNKDDISGIVGKDSAAFTSGEVAWLLNTTGGTTANSKKWAQGETGPIFASADGSDVIYRALFQTADGTEVCAVYGKSGTGLTVPSGCTPADGVTIPEVMAAGDVTYTVIPPVSITTQPTAEQALAFGSTVTLTVETDVTVGVSYQWYDGETVIADATQASYTTDVNMAIGEHSFSCQVSCKDYTVTSNAVPITYSYDEPALVDGVYQIASASNLYWFAAKVNGTEADGTQNKSACAKLTADITVNTNVLNANGSLNETDSANFRAWTPIGNDNNQYTGTFDGDGHTISGLYFNDTNTSYVGLFGYNTGTIQNVTIADSYFNGNDYIGGICGYNMGTITNCSNSGYVSGSSNYVGGICGYNMGTITNCSNSGYVSGSSNYVGGISGYNSTMASIANCSNSGSVSGSNTYVGGICGYGGYRGAIANCSNSGSVKGIKYVGGICGFNASQASIANCSNSGGVSGSAYVGGICGRVDSGIITNCYFDSSIYAGEAVGSNWSGTVTVTEGKTTEQFKSGEVAYLLNGTVTDGVWSAGATDGSQAWYQTIGTDTYPVLDKSHGTVYQDGDKYTNTAPNPTDLVANIAGISTSLEGNIGINYYVKIADSVKDTAFIRFTKENGTVQEIKADTVEQKEVPSLGEGSYYKFVCKVTSVDMTQNVTAQMFAGPDDETGGTQKTYSVKSYAELILKGDYSENSKELLRAMLNYGGYAQTNFERNKAYGLANAGLYTTETDPVLTGTDWDLTGYAHSVEGSTEGFTLEGASLLLDSETALRIYYTLEDGTELADYKITVNGSTENYGTGSNSNGSYLEIPNIAANALDTKYTICVQKSSADAETFTLVYFPLSYARIILNGNDYDENLKNMLKALVLYNKAADAY